MAGSESKGVLAHFSPGLLEKPSGVSLSGTGWASPA